MILVLAITFLSGLFVGVYLGMLAMALAMMAKRNDEDVPETRIGVTREGSATYGERVMPRQSIFTRP